MAVSPAYTTIKNPTTGVIETRIKKTLNVDGVIPTSLSTINQNIEYEYFEAIAALVPTAGAVAIPLALNHGALRTLDASFVGTDRSIYISQIRISVNGATALSGGTGTLVKLVDSANNVLCTWAVAGLTGNSLQGDYGANVTPGSILLNGTRQVIAGNGLSLVADNNFGAGSTVQIFVAGTIH